MAKLEDLKGRKIVNARIMPNIPPEEYGQLELELDDGTVLSIERGDNGDSNHYLIIYDKDRKRIYTEIL